MIGPRSWSIGRLNRAPSPLVAHSAPWLAIVLASAAPSWPMIASLPLMPPLGFLMLLGWRQINPGVLPIWAGMPLGLFDDLVSGQPLGSGVLLWSAAILGLEAIEIRWPWRNFAVEWAVSSVIIAAYVLLAGLLASGTRVDWISVIPPQIAVSILAFPVIGRVVGWIDRLRLTPLRRIA